MKQYVEERVKEEAVFFLETEGTVRKVAKQFGVGRQTAYVDLAERLAKVNPQLHIKVMELLLYNRKERAKRGGEATRKLWEEKRAKMRGVEDGQNI